MYKRHKFFTSIIFIIVAVLAFVLKADYSKIAETAISVTSIALSVYIGAASVILGSSFAEKLKRQADSEIRTKTNLGVLATYLRVAGACSLIIIMISTIYVIDLDLSFVQNLFESPDIYNHISQTASLLISSLACGMFSINILFSWLILIFLINSLGKSV